MDKKVYNIEYKGKVLKLNFDPYALTEEWQRQGVLELEYKHLVESEIARVEMNEIVRKLGW